MGNEAAVSAGCWDLRPKKMGYVYVGGYQPHPDVLYIKAGKTQRPKDRVKNYGGMVPGGLSFMHAGKVENPAQAEKALMAAIAAIEGVEAVGGEWFRCKPFLRLPVLDQLHLIGKEVCQVRTYCPAPFGAKVAGERCVQRRRRK